MGWKLTRPMIITPRRLPGVDLGTAFLSVREDPEMSDGRERVGIGAYLDEITTPAGESTTRRAVWRPWVEQRPTSVPDAGNATDNARNRLCALLNFLADDARHFDRGTTPPDGWTFNQKAAEWASGVLDVIEIAAVELKYPEHS